ncbi:unnamed protein product [Caenorhabditis bovis]|uniref:Uncharacterized protein n=1 Tax=Caenorhabditis bovis TaxID=2654633 RepID=A0A8S1ENB0_9PELO|nr:unnamed protein product [Caenorhabditis bovis]
MSESPNLPAPTDQADAQAPLGPDIWEPYIDQVNDRDSWKYYDLEHPQYVELGVIQPINAENNVNHNLVPPEREAHDLYELFDSHRSTDCDVAALYREAFVLAEDINDPNLEVSFDLCAPKRKRTEETDDEDDNGDNNEKKPRVEELQSSSAELYLKIAPVIEQHRFFQAE